jgi:hypothetical protein
MLSLALTVPTMISWVFHNGNLREILRADSILTVMIPASVAGSGDPGV